MRILSLSTYRFQKGFTLLELLIVLAILAIATAIVGIAVHRGTGGLDLRTFTKEVSATLRYARSHAISEKLTYTFFIWEDKKAYGLYADLPHKDISDATPVIYKPVPEKLQPVFKNQGNYIRIDFFPQGNSTGGTIEIKGQGEESFIILVNRVTGRVKIQKRKNEN